MENLSTGPIGVALELHQVEDTESLVSSMFIYVGFHLLEFTEDTGRLNR